MPATQLAKLLDTFGQARIGMQEAALLCAIDKNTTIDDIVATLPRLDKVLVRSRLAILRSKGLIRSEFRKDGRQVHNQTAYARKLFRK